MNVYVDRGLITEKCDSDLPRASLVELSKSSTASQACISTPSIVTIFYSIFHLCWPNDVAYTGPGNRRR